MLLKLPNIREQESVTLIVEAGALHKNDAMTHEMALTNATNHTHRKIYVQPNMFFFAVQISIKFFVAFL